MTRSIRLLLIAALFAAPAALGQTSEVKTLPFSAADAVYSPTRDLLYIAVPGSSPQQGRTITVVNPGTGGIVTQIPLERDPGVVRLTPDERFLLVGQTGGQITKVDLETGGQSTFSTAAIGISYSSIYDIDVVPGQPQTLVVTVGSGVRAIAVFDDGVMRQKYVHPGTPVLSVEFGSNPNVLWGCNSNNATDVYRFDVDAEGIAATKVQAGGLMDHFDARSYGGLLYTRYGTIADLDQNTLLGKLLLMNVDWNLAFDIDRKRSKALFFSGVSGGYVLSEFDLATMRLSRASATMYLIYAEQLTACGDHGVLLYGSSEPVASLVPLSLLNPVTHWIRPTPVPLSNQVRRIPLINNGLVADRSRSRLYASLPNWAYDIGNAILPIDPVAGTLGEPVWVGSDPTLMAVSSGGEYLYASLYGSCSIARIRLPELTPDLRIPLFSEKTWPYGIMPTRASEILPLPNAPGSIVVNRSAGFGGDFGTVAVYDGPVKRPGVSGSHPDDAIDSIQWSESGHSIYGYPQFRELDVVSTGVTLKSATPGVAEVHSAPAGKMRCQYGLCFGAEGSVIDAPNQERVTTLPFELDSGNFAWPQAVVPDLDRGLVYFLSYPEYGLPKRLVIQAFDVQTNGSAGQLIIPSEAPPTGSFLMWSNDQLAVSTSKEVILIPLNRLHSQPLLPAPLKSFPPMKRLAFPLLVESQDSFTGFAVSNLTASGATVRWSRFDSHGSPLNLQPNFVACAVPGFSQWARLGSEIFSSSQIWEGAWVEASTENSGVGGFFLHRKGEGWDGATAASQSARDLYFSRVLPSSGQFRGQMSLSTIYLVNPHGFQVEADFKVVGNERLPDTSPLVMTLWKKLPAKSITAIPTNGLTYWPDDVLTHVEVSVKSSRGGLIGFQMISLPSVQTLIALNAETAAETTRLFSAQLASGPDIFTDLRLVNTTTAERLVTLRAVGENGVELAPSVGVRIGPEDAFEKDVSQLFAFTQPAITQVGSLLVESDAPGIVGSVVFGDPERLDYAAALPLQTQLFTHAVFSHVANVEGFFTGLAFLNPGATPSVLTLEVHDLNGGLVGTTQLTLQPGQRVARLLHELIPASAGQDSGYVEVRSSTPLVGQQLFGNYLLTLLSAVPPLTLE